MPCLGRRTQQIAIAAVALGAALCAGDGPASRRACAETLADSLATLPPVLAALGGDLITFAAATAEVQVATLVAAHPDDVQAVLRTPAAYRQAIPALERADVIGRRARAGGGEDLLVDWELEIPLFNLKGKMWVGGDGQRVVLDLFEGNFAPGQLVFTWGLGSRPGQTVLTLKAAVSNQTGGWLIRSVAARSRFAGPAINAAAAYVAVRATAALAEHPGDPGARRPQAAPAPPPLAALSGRALAERLLGAEGVGASCLGLVKRAPSGRLALVEIAAPTRRSALEVSAALAEPESWRAFPGWKHVDRLPPARGAGNRNAIDVEVRDNIPFVDMDAHWRLWPGPPARAQAIAGDGRGAVLGWDVVDSSTPRLPATAAVLSMYPRLEALGYVPRKFIAAEPLLEHGLALALAYVDALSAREAIDAAAPPDAGQKRQ